jgi:hypothetical protein
MSIERKTPKFKTGPYVIIDNMDKKVPDPRIKVLEAVAASPSEPGLELNKPVASSEDDHKAMIFPPPREALDDCLYQEAPLGLSARARMGRGRRGRRGKAPALPPELNASPPLFQVLRYIVGASPATTTTVNVPQMIAACGAIGTVTNSTVATVFSTVRVHSITIWPGLSDSSGNPTSNAPEIQWIGTTGSVLKDTSRSKSVPFGVGVERALFERPPPDSLASDWLFYDGTTATELFNISGLTAGSIIDVAVTATMKNNVAGVSVSGVATVTLGSLYWLYLDGSTAHKLQPVARPSTF